MSLLSRIAGAARRERIQQTSSEESAPLLKPGQGKAPPAEAHTMSGMLAADADIVQLRDDIAAGITTLIAAVQKRDDDQMLAAQQDLNAALQGLFEFGLAVDEELALIVAEKLDELPGGELAELDELLAELEWDGDMPSGFQVLTQGVKSALEQQAMTEAAKDPAEFAHWKREHRDIGVQLNWLAKPMSGSTTLGRAAATLPSLMERDDGTLRSALKPDGTAPQRLVHDFEQHVALLLRDWSNARLVCLKYNLDHLPAPLDARSAGCVNIIARQLAAILDKRGVNEPFPEPMILQLANNAIDPDVLAGWLSEGRVDAQHVESVFARWSTHSLEQVAALEARDPHKYGELAGYANAVLHERKHDGFVPAAPMLAHASASRFFRVDSRMSVALEQAADTSRKFVARYTTWGSRLSLGSVLNTTLRYLTLSEPARRFGNWVQRGHDSGARYAAGAVIKGLASVTGGASAIVASTVTVAETIVSNVVNISARAIGGLTLALAGAGAKLVGLLSPSADRAGDKIVGTAKGLVNGISLVAPKGRQVAIPPQLVGRAAKLALLARITGSTTAAVSEMDLPHGFTRAHLGIIPREILSVEGGGSGTVTKLRFDEKRGVLTGDRWSGLKVGVYVEEDEQGNGIAFHLSFVGTQAGRPATLKSDAAQSFFGFEDSAFQEADALVKAFVQRYGADRVKLQGHSLGGGLAQWAGIRNSGGDYPVQVTCFNAAGLHIAMRNRLGDALIARSDVEHFNTAKDVLSQRVEGARSPFLGAQVGRRYVIPDSKGHSLRHHVDGLEQLAA